jgi:hypothetical protein
MSADMSERARPLHSTIDAKHGTTFRANKYDEFRPRTPFFERALELKKHVANTKKRRGEHI